MGGDGGPNCLLEADGTLQRRGQLPRQCRLARARCAEEFNDGQGGLPHRSFGG